MTPVNHPSILFRTTEALKPRFLYLFDVLVLKGRDVMSEPLSSRRKLTEKHILGISPKLDPKGRRSG
ncbi:MAG: hypothetical protein JWQ87_4784 [Candidatus Sulfotelmatobacter sp.]|nr:hypothetical protein [Candidatus Sulfotelmatobacter sp.]